MAIKVTSKTFAALRHVGKMQPTIDANTVATALGARIEHVGSFAPPHDLRHIAAQVACRLRSTGGRPGLLGVRRHPKIPLTQEDWSSLIVIASRMSRSGRRVSPTQVASALLHERLSNETRLAIAGSRQHGTALGNTNEAPTTATAVLPTAKVDSMMDFHATKRLLLRTRASGRTGRKGSERGRRSAPANGRQGRPRRSGPARRASRG